MNRWFYVQNNQQLGPVSQDLLVEKLSIGELNPDTLVWSDPMPEWQKASDVDDIQTLMIMKDDSSYDSMDNSPGTDYQEQILNIEGSQVRPWVRYFARSIDITIFGNLILAVLYLLKVEISFSQEIGLFILFAFIWIFIEPIFISNWATTPGKWLLRVHVFRKDGSLLSSKEAIKRAFWVLLRGQAMSIPPFTIFANIIAFSKLRKGGQTTWDRDGNWKVTHQRIGFIRIFAAILLFMLAEMLPSPTAQNAEFLEILRNISDSLNQ